MADFDTRERVFQKRVAANSPRRKWREKGYRCSWNHTKTRKSQGFRPRRMDPHLSENISKNQFDLSMLEHWCGVDDVSCDLNLEEYLEEAEGCAASLKAMPDLKPVALALPVPRRPLPEVPAALLRDQKRKEALKKAQADKPKPSRRVSKAAQLKSCIAEKAQKAGCSVDLSSAFTLSVKTVDGKRVKKACAPKVQPVKVPLAAIDTALLPRNFGSRQSRFGGVQL